MNHLSDEVKRNWMSTIITFLLYAVCIIGVLGAGRLAARRASREDAAPAT